eukprot:gene6584-1174_t
MPELLFLFLPSPHHVPDIIHVPHVLLDIIHVPHVLLAPQWDSPCAEGPGPADCAMCVNRTCTGCNSDSVLDPIQNVCQAAGLRTCLLGAYPCGMPFYPQLHPVLSPLDGCCSPGTTSGTCRSCNEHVCRQCNTGDVLNQRLDLLRLRDSVRPPLVYSVTLAASQANVFHVPDLGAPPATNQRCALPADCMDGILNGDEVAIDCGGSKCPGCNELPLGPLAVNLFTLQCDEPPVMDGRCPYPTILPNQTTATPAGSTNPSQPMPIDTAGPESSGTANATTDANMQRCVAPRNGIAVQGCNLSYAVDNALPSGSGCASPMRVGQQCQFVCKRGFQRVSGSPSLVCTLHGLDGTPPKCVEHEGSDDPGDNPDWAIGVLVLVGVVGLCGVICCAVVYVAHWFFRRRRKTQRREKRAKAKTKSGPKQSQEDRWAAQDEELYQPLAVV